jgi:hypothetical protein
VFVILGLLFVYPAFSQASGGDSPISIPDGTTIDTIKYGVDKNGQQQKDATLKPAEQVAFLFVYDLWNLERDCIRTDSGLGHLCSLGELVKGATTKSGQIIGLTVDPVRDTNYRYRMTIIGGNEVIIMALPKSPGLGAFALVGTPDNDRSDFYYNPKGPNLELAKKLYSMGYEGSGFKRLATSVPAQSAASVPAQTAASAPAQTTDFFELVQSGTAQDVQAAISGGADVKAKDKDGMTALILAAGANQDPEVITTLVKAGADVNTQVSNGTFKVTPLVAAAWQNANPEVVAALFKAGADLSRDGGMALGVAAAYNPNSEMILELLKDGADAKFKDASGKTAFFYAQQRADLKGTEALQKLQAASQ